VWTVVAAEASPPEASSYPCPDCDQAFPSPGKLRVHGASHSGLETPFECLEETCDKKFTSRFKLKRHVLIHSGDKQFTCSVCSRPFRRKDHLKNHEKVHSASKTVYSCPAEGCSRNYNSYTSYRKHMALHSAEQGALDCKICHKEHPNRETLMSHLKVHYGSRSSSSSSSSAAKSSDEKKFPCNQCERRFFTRKDLKRHSVVHTGDREFPCPHCTQRFGRKDHMVRHAKKSHPLEYALLTPPGNKNLVKGPFIKEEEKKKFLVPKIEPIEEEPSHTVDQKPSLLKKTSSPPPPPPSLSSTTLEYHSPPPPPTPLNPSGYSPVPSPGLAHIFYNDSSSEQDLDSLISQLVHDSSDLPLHPRGSTDKSLVKLEESPPSIKKVSPSEEEVVIAASSSSSASPPLPPSPSVHHIPPSGLATGGSSSSRYLRMRNPSSDSVTHTKNPVLPSVYADNALIVPEPSKTKYPSSFQIDSEDSLSDLRALLPDQVFNQL
ncbi:Uncharacterized protein FKW44_020447, partial [Caligus rogercresseyi]